MNIAVEPEAERGLYPPIEPHHDGVLPVSGGHRLAFEVCGNPTGCPAVVLHGGRVPAARRCIAGSSTPRHIGSCCSISAAPADRPPRSGWCSTPGLIGAAVIAARLGT